MNHSVFIEKWWPLVFSTVVAAMFYIGHNAINDLHSIINSLLNDSLNVFSVLLGFLLTILTIINSINTRRMNFIRDVHGLMDRLNGFLREAIYLNLISITFHFIWPFLESNFEQIQIKKVGYTFFIFLVVFTWVSTIRFSIIFIKLILDPNNNKKPNSSS